MSKFENVDTRVLLDMLVKQTERLTKIIHSVRVSKEFEEHKKQIKAIQVELEARKMFAREEVGLTRT